MLVRAAYTEHTDIDNINIDIFESNDNTTSTTRQHDNNSNLE